MKFEAPELTAPKGFLWGKLAFARNEQMTDEGLSCTKKVFDAVCVLLPGLPSSAPFGGTFPQGKAFSHGIFTTPANRGIWLDVMTNRNGRSRTKSMISSGGAAAPQAGSSM